MISAMHPMTNTAFHYSFALEDRREKLEVALKKLPRNDKEVTFLRQSVWQLKIANNEEIKVDSSKYTARPTYSRTVKWGVFGEAIEYIHINRKSA